jgi:hypothetical protein
MPCHNLLLRAYSGGGVEKTRGVVIAGSDGMDVGVWACATPEAANRHRPRIVFKCMALLLTRENFSQQKFKVSRNYFS